MRNSGRRVESLPRPTIQARKDLLPKVVLGFFVRATRPPSLVLGFIVLATRLSFGSEVVESSDRPLPTLNPQVDSPTRKVLQEDRLKMHFKTKVPLLCVF